MFMLVGVTGADGFIGSYLVKQLKEKGHKTRSFQDDLSDRGALDKFTDGCDQVIHLAGVFSNDFDCLINVNVSGTRNVVDACKKNSVQRIIFSSTGAVYGEPLHNGISLEDDVLSPNTLYGLSKLYAEEYLRFSGVNFVVFRFPNVYGVGNEKGVIYHFLQSIDKSKKVTIFGSGEQKRNFLFVTDAVSAIIRALEYSGNAEVFNISDRLTYSLNDIVSILKEKNLSFEVEYQSADESNTLQNLSEDISKAKRMLAWEPMVGLKDGLELVMQESGFNG